MKEIKKRQIISGVLAAAMLCAGTGVFAETAAVTTSDEAVVVSKDYGDATYQKQNISGTVKSIEESQILIADGEDEIAVNTDKDTLFLTADGIGSSLEEIKEGDVLSVVAANATTMSIPPQSYGYVVIKGDKKSGFPVYMEVSSIEKDEKGNISFLSADGMYQAAYSENTRVMPFRTKNIIDVSDINEGSKILVYSDLMTMSIPALVPATRIVLLEKGEEKEISETGKIILNGDELAVKVEKKDGNVFLPVRAVCEKAGLDVEWNDGLRAVRVGTVQMGVTFNIGVNKYNKAKMAAEELSAAPELIDEKAYLPLDFFTEMLEGKAEINENGVLSLSL